MIFSNQTFCRKVSELASQSSGSTEAVAIGYYRGNRSMHIAEKNEIEISVWVIENTNKAKVKLFLIIGKIQGKIKQLDTYYHFKTNKF